MEVDSGQKNTTSQNKYATSFSFKTKSENVNDKGALFICNNSAVNFLTSQQSKSLLFRPIEINRGIIYSLISEITNYHHINPKCYTFFNKEIMRAPPDFRKSLSWFSKIIFANY